MQSSCTINWAARPDAVFTAANIMEFAHWFTANPELTNTPAFAPIRNMLQSWGLQADVIASFAKAPLPEARTMAGSRGASGAAGMLTRQANDLGEDCIRAAAKASTTEILEANDKELPWFAVCGLAKQTSMETWFAAGWMMYVYVSSDGTFCGVWPGPIGYHRREPDVHGDPGPHTWETLPVAEGEDVYRLHIPLAYMPADPGRRKRLHFMLTGILHSWMTDSDFPYLPHRVELGYSSANPCDAFTSWHITPECHAATVYRQLQQVLLQDVAGIGTMSGFGVGNTTFPILQIIIA
jgi:hypothetical protein